MICESKSGFNVRLTEKEKADLMTAATTLRNIRQTIFDMKCTDLLYTIQHTQESLSEEDILIAVLTLDGILNATEMV